MHERAVCQRDTHVVRLCPVQDHGAVELAVGAPRGCTLAAVETGPAGDGEGGDDAVAGLEVLDAGADGADLACEFVAHDEVCARGLVAAEDMKLTVYIPLSASPLAVSGKKDDDEVVCYLPHSAV